MTNTRKLIGVSFFFTLFAQAQLTLIPLNADRVARGSQGVLDWHIQHKMAVGGAGLNKMDACFLKVDEENKSTLEVYLQACPAGAALTSLRATTTPVNVFPLSPRLRSRAQDEVTKLLAKYSAEVPSLAAGLVDRVKKEASEDSLGQIIFMELGGKKASVGYIDNDNRVMELCSGAWSNLCYFRNSKFTLGQEKIARDWDPNKSDWEWPRTYTNIVEIVSSAVFTRGNDDSRDQALYTLKLNDGKKVPISEEWYFFFSMHQETRHLVEKVNATSDRTRDEWNYMTAIHPVTIAKVEDSESSETSYQLFMGASVFYRTGLNIENADCDMAETEGFELKPLEPLTKMDVIGPGSPLTDLERILLFQRTFPTDAEIENGEESKYRLGELMKTQNSQFIGHRREGEEGRENNPNGQQKYLPPFPAVDKLVLFGMTSQATLGERIKPQVLTVLKSQYEINGLLESPHIASDPQKLMVLAASFNQNQLKEIMSIEPERNGKVNIRLEGYNPNEMITNNKGTMKFPTLPQTVNFDTEAVFPLWNSNEDKFLPTHVIGRSLSQNGLKDLRAHLSLIRKKAKRPEGFKVRKDFAVLAAAYEAGEPVLDEERDDLITTLDKDLKFMGRNVYKSFGIRGRADYQRDFFEKSEYAFVPEMAKPNWEFPQYYLGSYWDGAKKQSVDVVMELKPEDIALVRTIVTLKKKYTNFYDYVLDENAKTINLVLNDAKAYSKSMAELASVARVGNVLEKGYGSGGYFDALKEINSDMVRFGLATAAQKDAFLTLINTEAKYAVLRPYKVMRGDVLRDMNKPAMFSKVGDCFKAAGKELAKLKACAAASKELTEALTGAVNDAEFPMDGREG